jgi:hypothetical protein
MEVIKEKLKCPYSKKTFDNPRSMNNCGHTFDHESLISHYKSLFKKTSGGYVEITCPQAMCKNRISYVIFSKMMEDEVEIAILQTTVPNPLIMSFINTIYGVSLLETEPPKTQLQQLSNHIDLVDIRETAIPKPVPKPVPDTVASIPVAQPVTKTKHNTETKSNATSRHSVKSKTMVTKHRDSKIDRIEEILKARDKTKDWSNNRMYF